MDWFWILQNSQYEEHPKIGELSTETKTEYYLDIIYLYEFYFV